MGYHTMILVWSLHCRLAVKVLLSQNSIGKYDLQKGKGTRPITFAKEAKSTIFLMVKDLSHFINNNNIMDTCRYIAEDMETS
jgi:hypothetical protein